MAMTTCPECCGAKLIGRYDCGECRGAGVVPAEREEWRVIGEECRDARLSIRATMAEAVHCLKAKGMPVTIADVAAMEAGLANPEPLYRHWFREGV